MPDACCDMIVLKVNGQPQQALRGASMLDVLKTHSLAPDKVAVELNRRLLKSDRYAQPLSDGDEIEIVTFVGGG